MADVNRIWERNILFGLFCFLLVGCSATTKPHPLLNRNPEKENPQAVVSAVQEVVGAVSGQDVKSQDLRQVAQQIQKDQQARSAVQAIADSMSSKNLGKYCPVDGKRYDSHFEKCPEHGVVLQPIKE